MRSVFQKIARSVSDPSRFVTKNLLGKFRPLVRSYCPICKKGSRFSFIAAGTNRRPNAFCPVCGSMDRHRFIWLCLENEDLSQGTLLHFAPERCFSKYLKKLLQQNYVTGDIRPGRAQHVVDITDICFPDETFDRILCNHVLEHIPDDAKAFSELYRALKRGGTAFLSVPLWGETTDEDLSVTDPKEREKRFGQWDHVRLYGADFKNRAEKAGFDVTVIVPKDIVANESVRTVLGIDTNDEKIGNTLFLCRKQ